MKDLLTEVFISNQQKGKKMIQFQAYWLDPFSLGLSNTPYYEHNVEGSPPFSVPYCCHF